MIYSIHIQFNNKKFFDKNGFKTAVLGLSGGLDSAVVAVLAAKVLIVLNEKIENAIAKTEIIEITFFILLTSLTQCNFAH